MKNYPNYSRVLYDSYFTDLASITKLKKKDLQKSMKDCKVSVALDKLLSRLRYQRNYIQILDYMENTCETYEYLSRFPEALHFVLVNSPEEFKDVKLFDKIGEDTYVIDFRFKDVDYCIEVAQPEEPFSDGVVSLEYRITLFGRVESLDKGVEALNYDVPHRAVPYTHLYEVYLSVKENKHTTVCPIRLKALGDSCDEIAEHYGLPNRLYLINVVNHVLKCYHEREVLMHKSSKAHKVYAKSEVVIRRQASTEDKYISLPLHLYVKEYRAAARKEHQGGSHASPCAHVRRGYYRKSRGKGQFDLINGKFVDVGKGNGSYSFVKATRVNSEKVKENVTIYKV